MGCYLCGTKIDIRPYGPKGAMICFDCMMSSKELEAEAIKNFANQLDACGDVAIIDGTEIGPYPEKSLN